MPETFANDAQTTLNGAINDTTTSITVTSATGFPSSGNYRIRIDNEFMLVTAGQGTTSWTVTREAEDASRFPKASHSSGATVTHVLTVGGLTAWQGGNAYVQNYDATAITISSGNTPVDLVTTTISSAPAGVYLCVARMYVNTAGTSNVWMEAQSNGGGYAQLDRRDCRTITGERMFMYFYSHTGGNLDARLRGYYESSNAVLGLSGDHRWSREIVVVCVART